MPSEQNRITLSVSQQARLLACRAAWEEGEDEERLLRLRLREEDDETLRALATLLDETGFAQGRDLTYAQTAQMLARLRALAPNPNLDSRLLRRPGEPVAFQQDVRDLLYGKASPSVRLRQFLARRHAGGQTALQILCAVFPEQWPLVTRVGLQALEVTPEQRQETLTAARERFALPPAQTGQETRPLAPVQAGVPDGDPILQLLADTLLYEAARDVLETSDYVQVHRLLTAGLAGRLSRRRRLPPPFPSYMPAYAASRADASFAIREPDGPEYQTQRDTTEDAPLPPPMIDLTGAKTAELLAYLETYFQQQGFTYPPLLVRDYYIALQSKSFALLSGLSGTGKTRLTALFAEALTAAPDAQYRLLPVRPDWADSTPLLGYVNLLAPGPDGRGLFVSTPFLDFLRRASRPENAHRAYFLCLDEMNLARVEYYLAEILSAMETPTRELLLPNGQPIRLPANLFLTGTLNLDEATHTLSRKVLDRANTITLREVCLREDETVSSPAPTVEYAPETRQALFLQARAVTAAQAREKLRSLSGEMDFAARVLNTLAEANDILQPHGLHFAYRVRDEVLRYCANSFDVDGLGLLTPDQPDDAAQNLRIALDLQLLQKVLPRLSGAREQVEAPARDLKRWAERVGFARAAQRLDHLLSRLERDGFALFDAL